MKPALLSILTICTALLVLGDVRAGCWTFQRGDVDADGTLAVTDAIGLLSYLFVDGIPEPPCLDAADVDDDGLVQITDAVFLVSHLFIAGSSAPPEPFSACGLDPTEDALFCLDGAPGCGIVTGQVCDISPLQPTALEGEPYVVEITVSCDPGPGCAFDGVSLVLGPATATITQILDCTWLLEWTPDATQVGDHGFTIRLAYCDGTFAEQSFVVAVADVNQPPTITSIPPTGCFNGYDVVAVDPDPGDILTYSLDLGPAGAIIDPVTGLMSWTPTAGQVGDHDVTVRVTDDGVPPLSDTQSFVMTVSPPPVITSGCPPTPIFANTLFSWDIDVQSTVPGDVLAFSLPVSPPGMTIDSATGVLTWTPTSPGTYTVTIRVYGECGVFAELTCTIVVL